MTTLLTTGCVASLNGKRVTDASGDTGCNRGVPYYLSKPEFRLELRELHQGKPATPAYHLAIERRPDPTQMYEVGFCNGWFSNDSFSIELSSEAVVTALGSSSEDETAKVLGSFADFALGVLKVGAQVAVPAAAASTEVTRASGSLVGQTGMLDEFSEEENDRFELQLDAVLDITKPEEIGTLDFDVDDFLDRYKNRLSKWTAADGDPPNTQKLLLDLQKHIEVIATLQNCGLELDEDVARYMLTKSLATILPPGMLRLSHAAARSAFDHVHTILEPKTNKPMIDSNELIEVKLIADRLGGSENPNAMSPDDVKRGTEISAKAVKALKEKAENDLTDHGEKIEEAKQPLTKKEKESGVRDQRMAAIEALEKQIIETLGHANAIEKFSNALKKATPEAVQAAHFKKLNANLQFALAAYNLDPGKKAAFDSALRDYVTFANNYIERRTRTQPPWPPVANPSLTTSQANPLTRQINILKHLAGDLNPNPSIAADDLSTAYTAFRTELDTITTAIQALLPSEPAKPKAGDPKSLGTEATKVITEVYVLDINWKPDTEEAKRLVKVAEAWVVLGGKEAAVLTYPNN